LRTLRIIPVMLVAACATGSPSSSKPVAETSRVTSGSQIGIDMMSNTVTHRISVNSPISVVWQALPAVFDSVGIKVANVDPGTHQIGNRGFAVGRQLGGVMTPRYFDCGSNGGASSAFSWDLFVSVVTTATAVTPGSTEVATVIDVKGRPVSTSGNWLQCATTGALEQKISEILERSLRR
jgi:hypothetical protein